MAADPDHIDTVFVMQEVHERARNYARKKIAGPFLLSEESRNFAIFLLGFHTPEKISPIQY